MDGMRAKKCVLITTAEFTKDAIDYVAKIDKEIILIDGAQLAADFMIEHNIGDSVVRSHDIKRVDSDYSDENGESPALTGLIATSLADAGHHWNLPGRGSGRYRAIGRSCALVYAELQLSEPVILLSCPNIQTGRMLCKALSEQSGGVAG